MSALENLAATKARADSRANFESFIAGRRAAGWSEADIADYTCIKASSSWRTPSQSRQ